MTRLALLAIVLAATPIAAELNVVAKLEDPRITDRKGYLEHDYNGTGIPQIIICRLYLPPKDTLADRLEWDLVFETDEIKRQAIAICKAHRLPADDVKITVRGREIVTLKGRALLIESIRSGW